MTMAQAINIEETLRLKAQVFFVAIALLFVLSVFMPTHVQADGRQEVSKWQLQPRSDWEEECKTRQIKAEQVRRDDRDLSTKEARRKYIRELNSQKENLEPCTKCNLDPILQLQIMTTISSIKGKVDDLNKKGPFPLPGNCQESTTLSKCKEICKRWKKANQNCRDKYRSKLEFFDTLNCNECVGYLKSYFDTLRSLLTEDNLDENRGYSMDLIRTFWGILYKISRDEICLKENAETIRKILLGSPDELITILEKILCERVTPEQREKLLTKKDDIGFVMNWLIDILLKEDPDLLEDVIKLSPSDLVNILTHKTEKHPIDKDLIEAMDNLPDERRSPLLPLFSYLAKEEDLSNIVRWRDYFKSLKEMKPERRNVLIESLPNMQWRRLDNLLDEVRGIDPHKTTKATISIYNFMFRQKPNNDDLRNGRRLNHLFRVIAKEKFAGHIIDKVERGTFDEIIYSMKIGEGYGEENHNNLRPADKDILFEVLGGIHQNRDHYVLMLRFVSKRNVIIYSANIEILVNPINDTEIIKKYESIIDDFIEFIDTLRRFPLNKAEFVIQNTDFEMIDRVILKDIVKYTKRYGVGGGKSELKEIKGVYVRGSSFWKGKSAAAAFDTFGSDLRDLIYNRIRELWPIRGPHASLLENPPDGPFLEVLGEYKKDIDQKQSCTTIFYNEGPLDCYLQVDIYFPKEQIENDIENVKKLLVEIISRDIGNYLNLGRSVGSWPQPSPPAPPPKHKYLTSFFMPGYMRTYYETNPSWYEKGWNWSNFALLGLSIASGSAYINTDYDNDALFHIGVTATVAFIVNGVLGVVDAAFYEPPKINTAGIAITGPYVSINGQYDEPALMFTFKF